MGIGCIVGSVLAVTVSMPFDDHAVFIALGAWYIVLLLFVVLFVAEPARFANGGARSEGDSAGRGLNPCRYLSAVCRHRLILHLSLLSLLMAWAESGVMASLFAFIGNEFGLERQGDSTLVFAVFALLMAAAVVLSGILLLPLKRHYDSLCIMVIAVSIKIAAFSLLAAVPMSPAIFKNYGVLYLVATLYGSSFLIWPTITGLLTKHCGEREQGTAFGILDAFTGIASILAPFSFGQLYVFSMGRGVQWLLFAVAIAFCIVSIVIIAYPLRAAVNAQRHTMELLRSRSDRDGADRDRESRYGSTHPLDGGVAAADPMLDALRSQQQPQRMHL